MASFIYYPFGRYEQANGSATTLTYDREYTDPETGFILMTNRCYDPETGQFLTVDPAVNTTGQAYQYTVRDDPLNATDPSGLSAPTPCGQDGGSSPQCKTLQKYERQVGLTEEKLSQYPPCFHGAHVIDAWGSVTSGVGDFAGAVWTH